MLATACGGRHLQKKVRSTCRFHEASFDVTIEAGFRPIETVRQLPKGRRHNHAFHYHRQGQQGHHPLST